MSTLQTIKEIETLGWQVRTSGSETVEPVHQAFFRGFSTPWRGSLAEVLADVQANQIPSAETK